MKRMSLLFLAILSTSIAYADEKLCWVTFDYGGDQTSGPGGQGGSMSTTADAFVYKRCQTQCYENLPNYENIKGIKTCTIDGIDIEQSKYKDIYLSHKANTCHVQVIGQYTHNLYMANSEEECKEHMANYIMCNIQDNKCTYSLGTY